MPDPDVSKMQQEYVAPRNNIEEKLIQIIHELTGIKEIGIHDNLFKLGMHSLLIIRASTRIEQELGVVIPIKEFFNHNTVEKLAYFMIYFLEGNIEEDNSENHFETLI